MTELSSEARQILGEHGWRDDRHVDTSRYEGALLVAGYHDFQPARDFLRCYGDLEIVSPGDTYLDTRIDRMLERNRLELGWGLGSEDGGPLYHIGSTTFDFMCLGMDASGRVYHHMYMTSQNFDGIDLYRIADSGEEAIEKLFREMTGIMGGDDAPIQGVWVAHS